MKKLILVVFLLLLSTPSYADCVGNDRDWQNLNRAKERYCSTPVFSQWFEDNNWKWCKVHDNNRGEKGTISKEEADNLMLCDCLNHSDMITFIKTPLCYISYGVVKYFHN